MRQPALARTVIIRQALALLMLGLVVNQPTLAIQPGDTAPLLELPLLSENRQVRLSDFEGKVVFVDFWASWCAPCRQSLPLYDTMYEHLGSEHFEILAVNLDEDPGDAVRFLRRHPVTYPVLSDPAATSANAWSVPAMPSSFLIGRNGKLVNIYPGFKASHMGAIEHDIKKLLEIVPVDHSVEPDSMR